MKDCEINILIFVSPLVVRIGMYTEFEKIRWLKESIDIYFIIQDHELLTFFIEIKKIDFEISFLININLNDFLWKLKFMKDKD